MFGGLLTLGGLMLRYPVGSETPLRGLDQFPLQSTVAVVVGSVLLATTWFFRSRTMRNIRWAVVYSLLLHLVLCVALRFVVVNLSIQPSQEPGEVNAPLRSMTLPDYGGMEAPQLETPEWQNPADIELTETELQELQRPAPELQPMDQLETPREIASARTTRREQQHELNRAEELELERQIREADAAAPAELDAPNVAAAQENSEAVFEARALNADRSDRKLNEQMEDVAGKSQDAPVVTETRIQRAIEPAARMTEPQLQSAQSRSTAQAAAVETQAREIEVRTRAAAQALAADLAADTPARRTASALPSYRSETATAPSGTQSRTTGYRPPGRRAMSSDSPTPTSGGSASLRRNASSAAMSAVSTEAVGARVSTARSANSSTALSGGPSASASRVARNSSRFSGSTIGQTPGAGLSSGSSSQSRAQNRLRSMGSVSGSGRSGATGSQQPTLGSAVGRRSSTGRRAADVGLPAGALSAEQSGTLVINGPQADGNNSGQGSGSGARPGSGRATGLGGPRMSSVARRSSGLPGSRRGGPSSFGSRTGSGMSRVGKSSARLSGRRGTPQPALGTRGEIASFVRRSQPGIGAVGTNEKISPGFSLRRPETKSQAVKKLGGNDASEKAVERGLEWLASHQYAAGNWSTHALNCQGHQCGEPGAYTSDSAATGLALLAFLGAGHTHQSGDYQAVVKRGLDWLIRQQQKSGNLFSGGSKTVALYSHGMAAIALCEAYGMTKDTSLRSPAQRSLDYIASSQHPEFGGWRYVARFESDTSVSGWQLMALKSGEMSGLRISPTVYSGIRTWLNSSRKSSGRYAYHPTQSATEAMSAEALLMRQFLGAKANDPDLIAGADYLRSRLPTDRGRDVYYWYYATQVMFHMQGDYWKAWNENLRDRLIFAQSKDGPTRGSWSIREPTTDKWGGSGGRHYMTCLNLLMLEVYYRHLPLYVELADQ